MNWCRALWGAKREAPAAVSQSKSDAPATSKSVVSDGRAKAGPNWFALGLGLVGLGVAGYSYGVHAEEERRAFDASQTVVDHDVLQNGWTKPIIFSGSGMV